MAKTSSRANTQERFSDSTGHRALFFGGWCFVLWFASSIAQLTKYASLPVSTGVCLLACLVFIAGAHLLQTNSGVFRIRRAVWVLFALWLAAVALFAILYPLANSGAYGGGSDRDSALINPLAALLRGEYPYYQTSDPGSKVNIFPGSLLLAAPFFLLGNPILQNIFWLGLFIGLWKLFFAKPMTMALFLLLFFFGTLTSLQDFVTGGDLTINALYVAIAVALALNAYEQDWPAWTKRGAAVFLGVVICTRPYFAVALPPLAAFVSQRRGPREAVIFCIIAVAVAAALVLPFYLYDPAHFTPARITRKLSFLDGVFMPAASLPLFALALASLAFFSRLEQEEVYGFIAVALVPILLPPAVQMAMQNSAINILVQFSYFVALTIFGGLWLLCRWERTQAPIDGRQAAPN